MRHRAAGDEPSCHDPEIACVQLGNISPRLRTSSPTKAQSPLERGPSGTFRNVLRARMIAGVSRTIPTTRVHRLRLAVAMMLLGAAGVLAIWMLWLVPGQAHTVNMEAACPLKYQRHTMQQVKSGTKPYLFGGKQLPNCTNCHKDHLWSKFCQYKSHGQICTPRDSEWLVTTYVNRNWAQLVTLTPCDLWPFMRERTIWIMGDSQSLDFFKALKCFFYEFWDLEGETLPSSNPQVLAVLGRKLRPECVQLPGTARICYVRFDAGQALVEEILPLYHSFGSPNDLLVANFGLHHGDREEYAAVLRKFVDHVRASRRVLPTILWQQTTPQHFTGFHGEYPGGSPPFECSPLAGVTLQPDGTLAVEGEENQLLAQGGWRNKLAAEALAPVGIPLLPSYNETVPLYYYHRDNGKGWECTHFCFPSAQQTWVFALYRGLVQQYTGKPLDPTAPFPEAGDASVTAMRLR